MALKNKGFKRMKNTIKFIASRAVFLSAILAFGLISGCATGPQANPTDPLEPLNRGIYAFNDGIDKAVLKPAALGYKAITPAPVRTGVSNFFNNLQDLWSSINGVLQLRPKVALDNFFRFGVNTTFGLAGVLDVASEMGIERQPEDFGKTLGRWGVPAGPYLVIPLLGPSTVRDSTTIVLENRYDPITQMDRVDVRNSLTALRIVDTRTNLLPLEKFLNDAALDKYSFTRDAFLQKRRAGIYRPGADKEDDYKQPADEKK
jgi:phospholipid-binding lipoprotein MlaA